MIQIGRYKFGFVPLSMIAVFIVLTGCTSQKFAIYQFDNGDDYVCEGLRRIYDKSGKIGFADEKGKVIISPRFAFAFPFEDGLSKATFMGQSEPDGEHYFWKSPSWFYINHKGDSVSSDRVVDIDGHVAYSPDDTPLKQTFITRLSDGYTFMSDDNGNFNIMTEAGDSLLFSYVGTVSKTMPVSIRDSLMTVKLNPYIPGNDEYTYNESFFGKYKADNDGSILKISKGVNGQYNVSIELYRLTEITDGIGTQQDGELVFTATDASGNPISGKITVNGNFAKLVFTDSTWEYLPNGTTFIFK